MSDDERLPVGNLGDRIKARRAARVAEITARHGVNKDQVLDELKAYVDEQIAALAAANGLKVR